MNKKQVLICCVIVLFFLGCAKENSALVKKARKDKESKSIKKPPAQPEETAQEDIPPEQEDPSVRTNPFLAPEEEDFLKSQEGKLVVTYLKLTAVFYSPPSSKAIIDGKIFKEGDIVDNKQIVKINPEEVILKDTKGEYIISMKNVLGRDS